MCHRSGYSNFENVNENDGERIANLFIKCKEVCWSIKESIIIEDVNKRRVAKRTRQPKRIESLYVAIYNCNRNEFLCFIHGTHQISMPTVCLSVMMRRSVYRNQGNAASLELLVCDTS
jgi:hypothetical protein